MTTTKSYDNLNRLTAISSVPSVSSAVNSSYSYNSANQRTAVTNSDSARWVYQYDSLGQVVSGKKYFSDGTPVAGEQFEYSFDDIGNRNSTKSGGDAGGVNLRSANYANNSLNQITSRDVPGFANILGEAATNAYVTVNNQPTYRKGEFFRKELAVDNSSSAVWLAVTNLAALHTATNDIIVTNSGNVFIPKTAEVFGYDADGNMTNDGRWTISWDGENRATSFTSLSSGPSASKKKIDCSYDYAGRRIQKIVSAWNGSSYVPQFTNRFAYDGWSLTAILNSAFGLLNSFLWGLDLSGSLQGAGGVGGLLAVSDSVQGNNFVAFDGNGNVSALINAATGTSSAHYEYGPFGELLRATGPMAFANPIRFSAKFQDSEGDFVYYGHRYYAPSIGRWLSRDPVFERGGKDLFTFIGNNPATAVDYLGLLDCHCPESACKNLNDLTAKLDDKINDELAAALVDSTPSLFLRNARDRLAKDISHPWSKGLTKIDGWIQDLGSDWREPGDDRWPSGFRYASCIKLTCNGKTRCIGADKISHFFQQGYMLSEVEQKLGKNYATSFSRWTEGFKPLPWVQQNDVDRWLVGGSFDFYGFDNNQVQSYYKKWGGIAVPGYTISPPSSGDQHANQYGMEFWDALKQSDSDYFHYSICDFIKDLDRVTER